MKKGLGFLTSVLVVAGIVIAAVALLGVEKPGVQFAPMKGPLVLQCGEYENLKLSGVEDSRKSQTLYHSPQQETADEIQTAVDNACNTLTQQAQSECEDKLQRLALPGGFTCGECPDGFTGECPADNFIDPSLGLTMVTNPCSIISWTVISDSQGNPLQTATKITVDVLCGGDGELTIQCIDMCTPIKPPADGGGDTDTGSGLSPQGRG